MPTKTDDRNQRKNGKQKAKREAQDEAANSGATWSIMNEKVRVDARRAAVGGVLAASVTLLGAWLVGQASGAEARLMLEQSLPHTRSLCSTVVLASSTILSLMLTLLSVSAGAEAELKAAHYQRVKQIAWVAAVTLIGAMLAYLLLNVPLVESKKAEEMGMQWFGVLYYVTLGVASLLGGALVSVVLMLFNTVRDIIKVVVPEMESQYIRAGAVEEEVSPES